MTKTHLIFTAKSIDLMQLPTPPKTKVRYYDQKTRGLGLYVTATGVKTFFIYRRIYGSPEMIILGRTTEITLEQARAKASLINLQIAEGQNPREQQRSIKQDMTFGELWTLYLERHAKMNRSSWRNDADLHRLYLEGWRNRKISYITSEAIRELHQKIGTDNGMVTANHVHALIRLMFNKAIEWGWNKPNPAYAVIQVSLVRLKPHSPDYRWTKIIPAAFDPAATCPTFDQSLRYWFNEDQEMINFIAQLVGMGLTGDTSEQKLVKMLGNGKNGKSVLADMVAYLAGDYTTLYLLNILSPNLGRPNT